MKAIKEQKVYGVPILPHKIDAMYDNVCRGNLVAYYLDSNAARGDEVYRKLGQICKKENFRGMTDSPVHQVANFYKDDIYARQMNESTYNHLHRTPVWLLKLEFKVRYLIDGNLRAKIQERYDYMYREDRKRWTDYPN